MLTKFLIAALLCVGAQSLAVAQTKDTPPEQRHKTSAEDVKAIETVIENFQIALKTKDVRLLSTLVLHSNIQFASPTRAETVQKVREDFDVNYDGLSLGGFGNFSQMILSAKEKIDEKFYNVKIIQDDNYAVVVFDFEFTVDDVIQNYGVESWQLMKTTQGWKIFSVTWSSRGGLK